MKMKKEYLILIAVIVALALYLGLRTRDRTHFELPRPAVLESGAIDRLVIARPDGTLELVKKDARWVIEPHGYRADETTVKNMLDQLSSLNLTALVSESERYERYDLNAEKRINVQAYTGDQKMRDLDVGRPAPTNQHTFVKLAGDPKVYHARGSLQNTFDKPLDGLRDKVVLAFERDKLNSIEIRKGAHTTVLAKAAPAPANPSDAAAQEKTDSPPPPVEWQAEDGRKADAAAVDQLLGAMSQLRCDGYIEQPGDPQEQAWELNFVTEGQAHRLTLFSKEENGNRFAARSSDSPYDFWLPEARVKTFEKQIDQLLGLEAPKADS